MSKRGRNFSGEYWQIPPKPNREERKKIRGILRGRVERSRTRRERPSLTALFEKELQKKNN
ncbi:hypothetical protein A3I27_00955 [Candidatus Giovannonibacteria bacterium RIFCSPLOWO2_02_FULL_43_11b]|uniref:Uncharacterized protein n=1 Tax=Candidatus Giovannonibacteria bacterium RIFCSPHIGHO2_12_FULL_43_15 TaxID=1798341 RepID=A0A1F5WPF6_9BACT|nr:MAG: hypothetical protein A2739_01160 [Candidatus Giovannonibacteria bacterium RIFCSPHIGHO2_01_FULL_43_100]OGF66777.1 MAG: hypothetical protein A3B97_02590 [Candidatus Giovannonibacteria bacterium RIFCSPHIGHO2_02_FULL_43_32]OGF77553.1 MAG: hypothetical protein A3F23_01085 [Candidatus Giovannonibacteria bacterium RIFCSPHIGHO2_12_FULL_43_15]OGF79014.1 MAG: hypothetical protein A3A15_00710 [Candidatus Giovannonibacteria bacterium RIFCSPLOWO2_01_FULL_43_60]OGF90372.1 MAG: hypothetical protein A3